MLVLIPRVLWQFRVGLAAAVLVLSLICLPKRLSSAQLRRLLPLCAFLFVGTAFSADQIAMAAPVHTPPPELVGLPSLEPLNDGYKYVSPLSVSTALLSVSSTALCTCTGPTSYRTDTQPIKVVTNSAFSITHVNAVPSFRKGLL